jgi:hypothetical protein
MTAVPAGGVPPSGLDMNGGMNALSRIDRWMCAGAGFLYDSTFAVAINGYPKGGRVLAASGNGYWLCTVDNNITNPDTGGAGWSLQGASASSSVYASAQQTLATGNSKVMFDTVEWDEGIWDAPSRTFVAHFAGKYRISGSILLSAPIGADYAIQIWKNGALAKQCFQAPQVSNVNLSMSFDAIFNLAIGGFLEAYVVVPSSPVLAGVSGSNQAYVFAQCAYIGS